MRGKLGVFAGHLKLVLLRLAGRLCRGMRLAGRAVLTVGRLAVMYAAMGAGNLLGWLKVDGSQEPVQAVRRGWDGEVIETGEGDEEAQDGETRVPWGEAIDEMPERDVERDAPGEGPVESTAEPAAGFENEGETEGEVAPQAGTKAVENGEQQAGSKAAETEPGAAAAEEAKPATAAAMMGPAAVARHVPYSAPEVLQSESGPGSEDARPRPADAVDLPDYLGAASRAFNKRTAAVRPLRKYLFPAAFSLLVLAAVYLFSGMFPLGGKTLPWANGQAVPYLAQFKDIITTDGGMFLSFKNAAGMDFWGVFLYYLASPFTLLSLLVSKEGMAQFANVLVMLKMILAACTATAYFRYRYAFFRRGEKQAGLLGVMYAFCGYTMLYWQNLVFLDELIYFPLLMMAFGVLVRKQRMGPFAFVLALMLLCQFQVGYSLLLAVLVFGGLYVVAYAKRRDKGAIALRLGLSLALALAASAVAWLPAMVQYSHAKGNVSMIDSLSSAGGSVAATALPVVLCTAAVLAAVVFLLVKRAFFRPRVIYVFVCFVLFCVPLVAQPVNRMWQGGSDSAFPARFGFIAVFFGLVLVAAALEKLDGVRDVLASGKKGYMFFGAAVALCLALYGGMLGAQRGAADVKWLAVSMLAGAAGFGLLFAARSGRLVSRQVFVLGLCALVALEAFYNCALFLLPGAVAGSEYKAPMAAQADAARSTEENFRMKVADAAVGADMPGAMGYDSLSHGSRFTRREYAAAMAALGYSGRGAEVASAGGTALSDDLLGVGGVLAYADGAWLVQPAAGGGAYARVVPRTGEELSAMPTEDRIATQEWLYYMVYGAPGQLLQRYGAAELDGLSLAYDGGTARYTAEMTGAGTAVYQIDAGKNETLYFDCLPDTAAPLTDGKYNCFNVAVNGETVQEGYPVAANNGILNLGAFSNETVTVELQFLQKACTMQSFGVFGVTQKAVDTAANYATKVPLAVEGNTIRATATADVRGELLLLAVPYDEGFKATVNGQDAEMIRVMDGFMAVELMAGANTVELRFVPRGLLVGAVLSALGMLGILLSLFGLLRRAEEGEHRVTANEKSARSLLVIVFLIGMIIVYILPFFIQGLSDSGGFQNFTALI